MCVHIRVYREREYNEGVARAIHRITCVRIDFLLRGDVALSLSLFAILYTIHQHAAAITLYSSSSKSHTHSFVSLSLSEEFLLG